MLWKFIVIGKPALRYAAAGVAEYLPRLQRYTRAEIEYLKDGTPAEVEARFDRAAADSLRVVMDERGESLTTRELLHRVDQWELRGTKKISVCIGGASGHSQNVRQSADLVLCLGKFTLQHELALLVLLEQIYRVYTLKNGEPYHRD
jgi:23S rRNA (pseudouridine1915-N3)-methyltransferase